MVERKRKLAQRFEIQGYNVFRLIWFFMTGRY